MSLLCTTSCCPGFTTQPSKATCLKRGAGCAPAAPRSASSPARHTACMVAHAGITATALLGRYYYTASGFTASGTTGLSQPLHGVSVCTVPVSGLCSRSMPSRLGPSEGFTTEAPCKVHQTTRFLAPTCLFEPGRIHATQSEWLNLLNLLCSGSPQSIVCTCTASCHMLGHSSAQSVADQLRGGDMDVDFDQIFAKRASSADSGFLW